MANHPWWCRDHLQGNFSSWFLAAPRYRITIRSPSLAAIIHPFLCCRNLTFSTATRDAPEHIVCGNENRRRGDRMALYILPRITRRLQTVRQDTGRPRSDRAMHGACRTMAQRYSAPTFVVEGASHQDARLTGRLSAPAEKPVSPPPPLRLHLSFRTRLFLAPSSTEPN